MPNQWLTDDYTEVVTKVLQEIVNDPSTYRGSKYLPSRTVRAAKVRSEVIEATGGLTNECPPGTDPLYIRSFGSRVQEFVPPTYKEAIHYDEKKILFLRELGQNDRSLRGIRQRMNFDIDRLNRRLEARIEKLRWDVIFGGGFTYGQSTISFGVPAFNRVVPVGPVWSTDGVNANPLANPIVDLRYWFFGGYNVFRKYKIRRAVMNPNTARWILDNPNVQSLVKNYFANETYGAYDLNRTLSLLIPGVPEIDVYDGWYTTEQEGPGNDYTTSLGGTPAAGQLVTSQGIFFIPDGYIYFEVGNLPGGDQIGWFDQTMTLATGNVDTPGVGKFLVVEECIAPGTKGGPGNPYIDILAGVSGGPNLERQMDVLTARVV